MTTVKITELTNIGANLATSTVVPVVNMAGTPTTQKTTVGNIANLILEGAGVDYPEASVALLAQTVSNAAQSNITSVGTLTGLTVSGNTNLGAVANVRITGGTAGQILSTDGAGNLSWASDSTTYGNSNVAAYLPTYTGNVGANWVIASYFMGNAHNLTYLPGANVNGAVSYATTANSVAAANVSGLGNVALSNYDGNASNVLHGDGSWSADTTTYSNSNVASFLAAYGSNTITTTGNVSFGNVTATNLGNISAIDLDGNSSNILYGNGVFDSIPNPFNQDLNTTDNVTFANITSTDAIRFSNSGNIVGALGYAPNAISIEGYGSNTVNITANDVYSWTFDGNGNLTLPGSLNLTGGHIQQSEDNDLRIVVQDVTDDGYNLDLIVSDGTVDNTLLRIANDEVRIRSNIANSAYDWTFSDQGTFFVAGPISGQYGSNLPIYILNNVGDGVGNVELQVVDYSSNSVLSNVKVGRSNVQIGTLTGTHLWTFDDTGKTTFPTLTVDLHNGGNQTAQTLQFGDDTQQAIITGPTPAANVNAQRLIIQGQRGNGTGEGGDVYFWAGDSDTNGGDIKIYAGDADGGTGYGGYVNIDAGNGPDGGGQLSLSGGYSSNGQGGQVTITPGASANANGAPLNLNGGIGSVDGGNVVITAGYGQANGGQVNITGGISALGLANYGNVVINAGASTWRFDNTGNIVLAGGNSVIYSIANSSLDPTLPNVSTMTLTPDANYNSQVLVLDPTAPGHIHLRAHAFSNIDDPAANIFLGGEDTAFEITSGSNNQALIHSNSHTWTFGNDSVLTIPGNLVASGASPAPTLSGFSSLTAADSITVGNANIYSNGHFAANTASFSGNVSGDVALFNDLNLNNLGTNAFLYTNSNRDVYDTQFGYDSANDTMSGGNISLTGNITATNIGNISSVNLDGSSSNVLYGNGVFAAAPGGGSYGDSNVVSLLSAFGSNTITTTGNVSVGNIAGSTNGYTLGYLNIPQVAASNATLALGDAGKHYYSTTAGNLTLTVPLNSSVAFPTGTAISIVVQAAGNVLVNAAAGVTLYMAGNSTAANRVVGTYGMATLMKVASDTWFINGTGVS